MERLEIEMDLKFKIEIFPAQSFEVPLDGRKLKGKYKPFYDTIEKLVNGEWTKFSKGSQEDLIRLRSAIRSKYRSRFSTYMQDGSLIVRKRDQSWRKY